MTTFTEQEIKNFRKAWFDYIAPSLVGANTDRETIRNNVSNRNFVMSNLSAMWGKM